VIVLRIINAADGGLSMALTIRLTALREICRLPSSYDFPHAFCEATRSFLSDSNQTTLLTLDDVGRPVACATMCYITLLPTFDHPTGARAHLMNVYTLPEYRRQGLSRALVQRLMDEARARGVTEISLDSTEAGRPLYASLGFLPNKEGMVYLMNGGSSDE